MPALVLCPCSTPFRESWADLARSGGIGEGSCAFGALESVAIMKFIVAIEPGTESTASGVAVPDLPGCFSAGDTMDEAMLRRRESLRTWAKRMGVSVATLQRLEAGDPSVSVGIVAIQTRPIEDAPKAKRALSALFLLNLALDSSNAHQPKNRQPSRPMPASAMRIPGVPRWCASQIVTWRCAPRPSGAHCG